MQTRLVRCALCAVALYCATARAEPAGRSTHDLEASAQAHYTMAVRKFDVGKYEEAAAEFVTAYEMSGRPVILYNIAQAYRLAGRFREAAQFYRSLLREVPNAENRDEISGRIAEMDEREQAQKREAERREAGPIVPGGAPIVPRDADAPPVAPRHPGRSLEIAGYSLCGVAAAGLVLGGVMSGLTVHEANKVQSGATSASGDHNFGSSLQAAQRDGLLYDKLQIVGYALAGAAAVGAVVTLALGFRADRQAQQAAREHFWANAVVAPALSTNGASVVFGGRF